MGLNKRQLAYGTEILSSRFTSSRFNFGNVDEHTGSINVFGLNGYVILGITNYLNTIVKVPYIVWRQETDESNNHHRNETIKGFRDISVGLRWILKNQYFGPGQRLFFGINSYIPTAESFAVNPYDEHADSVKHSHFALGSGHFRSDMNVEWWYRSEFPWIIGISGLYFFPWNESNLEFRSGRQLTVILHGIKQRQVFSNTYVYVKLLTRLETPDVWENETVVNSGGYFVDAIIGFNFEFTEIISGVVTMQVPIWRTFEGVQMDGISLSFSVRKLAI